MLCFHTSQRVVDKSMAWAAWSQSSVHQGPLIQLVLQHGQWESQLQLASQPHTADLREIPTFQGQVYDFFVVSLASDLSGQDTF